MIRRGVSGLLARTLGRLRYPWLFSIALVVLVLDLLVPDAIPFLDEILLAVVTVLLGARKRRAAGALEDSEGGR